METNFDKLLEDELPKIKDLATKEGNLSLALEQLYGLEKQTRATESFSHTSIVCKEIVKLCFECNEWAQLQECLILLSKKRNQSKTVIQHIVQEAMQLLDKTPDHETKMGLIDTLRSITEGKVYVEVERARITRVLCEIKEKEGELRTASKLLQELQVETFGQMEKREKVDFLLEQMRLCIALGDWTKCVVISRKITSKTLADESIMDLKIRYYELLSEYYSHKRAYLNNCRCYLEIFQTESVQKDKQLWTKALANIVIYTVLTPYGVEQVDLSHQYLKKKNLKDLPIKELLEIFLTEVLMDWKTITTKFKELVSHPIFAKDEGEKGQTWKDFHSRVVEHNIRVIEKYYSLITLKRLSELLELDVDTAERYLAELVSSKTVYAKIDRITGTVNFEKKLLPYETMDEWGQKTKNLFGLVESTCQLIQKEYQKSSTRKREKN
ncbi:26s proteasome non-atpase regulatory subunit [Anaeramoeba flamelloides]|uniref:26s proteasome non-atpase regulatory subunit n=1 Tax=Anaeramoeba flamelloides TaxID=1746091 RepID=A0AAV7YLJ5_9EUKA|nr:26s proteasome non-atpase regulatory subunit [Anaeramoeba flamelloides]